MTSYKGVKFVFKPEDNSGLKEGVIHRVICDYPVGDYIELHTNIGIFKTLKIIFDTQMNTKDGAVFYMKSKKSVKYGFIVLIN